MRHYRGSSGRLGEEDLTCGMYIAVGVPLRCSVVVIIEVARRSVLYEGMGEEKQAS